MTPEQPNEVWIMDARACGGNEDGYDKAVVLEICDTVEEAFANAELYGQCAIWKGGVWQGDHIPKEKTK